MTRPSATYTGERRSVMGEIIARHHPLLDGADVSRPWRCAAADCGWEPDADDDNRQAHARHVADLIRDAFTIHTPEQLKHLPHGTRLLEIGGTILFKGPDDRYHDSEESEMAVEGWREQCVELPALCMPWTWRWAASEQRAASVEFAPRGHHLKSDEDA